MALGALKSSQELVESCPCVPDRIGIWKCWLLRGGKNRSTRRKISQSKRANQPQTQPTYARIRTRATLVGDECSPYCAALALENTFNLWRMRIITQPHGLKSRTRRLRNDSAFLFWGDKHCHLVYKKMYGAKIIFENRKSSRLPVKFASIASTSRKCP